MSVRVILFSIDGMRPDALAAARTPNIDRLIENGCYTPRASSVMPSVTLPCHTSMLRGVDVSRHGITSNHFQPLARPVPSLFDVAHAAGKKTGFFFNWEPLRDLSEPGSLDVAYMWRDCYAAEGDQRVAETAVAHLRQMPLDFAFVYLGWTDECAHRNGWMSDPYLRAIENADACVGQVLSAAGDETVALVQSDHGGHGRSHGTDCDEDMRIPWLLSGPGVSRGQALDGEVRIYDTCVTLAHLLGLPPAPEWDGRVIEEALA
jgi:predicted AlkP superfamily pyrophosphatase or phosphodiesterase